MTDSADFADARNFYKVEKWTKDGTVTVGDLFDPPLRLAGVAAEEAAAIEQRV